MNKYDEIVLGALDIAQGEALSRKNGELDALHLLYGLMKNPATFASRNLAPHKSEIIKKLDLLPTSSRPISLDQIRPSSRFSEWMTHSSSHAVQDGRQVVSEKDLLRFMPKIFPALDIDYSQFKLEENSDNEVPDFLINLNALAEEGKLDPVIGRSREIRAVMEILGRRGKNNPVLVGPAGVGKTAIVEGLADAIVKQSVPDILRGKTVYSLNLGSLMAGTKFRGEFEERIQKLLKFIKNSAGESILFIDEIHMLVGAGKTDGAMDAANLLKPALARGELNCIGATTTEEYQKYILGDSALDRRFRNVPVNEPSIEDAVEILMGIKEKFEIHHGIKISKEAIYNSVKLSNQYITDKNLPDKAIDLIDESASALKLSAEAMPSKLVELESDIRAKKVLIQVEKNKGELEKEIGVLEEKYHKEKSIWETEVLAIKKVTEFKNQLEHLKFELEQAERKQDYERASQIKYSLIPEVQEKIEGISHDWILTAKDIGNIIARQTGIPLEKILQSKQDHILKIEQYIDARVFGQQQAIHEISETLIAAHAGLTDQSRPLGSFLLKGPSGVGKTETAKAITDFLFNSEKNLIRMDLSEFSEKHSVAKLIGAPAGYIGHDEGGILTEAVRRHPYSVLLFDEIEKAHADFSDILLQILDDGRLTDNKGRTIDFKNTIILITTNSKDIEKDFKPEVLGRLDAILSYNSLNKKVMFDLVEKQLKLLNDRLKNKSIELNMHEECYAKLGELGYDERYGARPLQSVFSRFIIRPLSRKLLQEDWHDIKLECIWHKEGGVEFISL